MVDLMKFKRYFTLLHFKMLSQVKSKFISIARLKTTELHQSAVQQI